MDDQFDYKSVNESPKPKLWHRHLLVDLYLYLFL